MLTLAGMTHEELLHEALVRTRDARVAYPDTREIRRPGWSQLITPSFRTGGLNGVEQAQMSEHEADAVIDATIAEYDAQDIWFRWTVGPDSRPADLGERLARRGLQGHRVIVMAAAIEDIPAAPVPGVDVERVTEANVETYARVVAEGWDNDPAPLLAYQRAVLADPGQHNQSFLAMIDGQPVGAANTACFERSAYFMGGVVLPAARGRGVYRALIAARLQAIAVRRIGLITSQAMESTSAPILARLGFVPIAEVTSYSRPR